MKLLIRIISITICLCLCVSLSACKEQKKDSGVSDSYLEGVDSGRLKYFLDLWDASGYAASKSIGESWDTKDFSLSINTTPESTEDNPCIRIDLALKNGTIDDYYKSEKILFSIYAYGQDGWKLVWDSDDYYMFFTLQTEDAVVGNKGYTEKSIPKGTDQLAVLLVIDGCLHNALYNVGN